MRRNFQSAPSRQRGFGLIQLGVALLVSIIVTTYAASKYFDKVYESSAEATGKYLLAVRGATVQALSTYEAALTNVDTSSVPAGTYPTAPSWAKFTGSTKTISVADLQSAGLLSNAFPANPPLGRSARITFVRAGTCPGETCTVDAYVATCWPIAKGKPSGVIDATTCPAPAASWRADIGLVGAVMQAAGGYGGSNALVAATAKGPLFSVASSSVGIPSGSQGNVVLLASLTDSLFPQFVRQGDTRHIYLNNALTVADQIETATGVVMNAAITPGDACTIDGMYATSINGVLSQCSVGVWVQQVGAIISVAESLANGATVSTPTCPSSAMTAFQAVSLQTLDVTMTGADIAINGSLAGGISGSGNVNSAGNVTVTGTFNGTSTSNSTSSIRVAQSATISGGKLVITPATANARAFVIAGCRYL